MPSAMRRVATAVSTSSYFANTGKPADAAIGVDLLDLAAGQPAQDVEVVDREVAEQPARRRDVRLVRRRRVVAGEADRVERAELAGLDQPARLAVARRRTDAGSRAGTGRRCARSRRRRRSCRRGRPPAASRRRSAGRARSTARIRSAWAVVAAAMTTASAASMAASMVGAAVAPTSAATSAARAGSASAMTTPSTPGVAASSRRVEPPDPAGAEQCDLHRASSFACARRHRAVAAPRPGPAGRSPRSPTADPSRCPARPSASRRSRARRAAARTPSRSSDARAELGEEARPDRRRRSRRRDPLRRPSRTTGSTSLRWTWRHAIAEVAQRRDRVAAADRVVADVEADADDGRVEARRPGGRPRPASRRTSRRGDGTRPDGRPRRRLGREPVEHLDGARPSRRRSARACRGSPARPAQSSRSGDTSRAMHEDLAAAVARRRSRSRADGERVARSVRRPSPGSTGRPRPVAGLARRARSRSASPSGKPMPSCVPS